MFVFLIPTTAMIFFKSSCCCCWCWCTLSNTKTQAARRFTVVCCGRGSVPLEDSLQRVASAHTLDTTTTATTATFCVQRAVALGIISSARTTNHCTWPPIVPRSNYLPISRLWFTNTGDTSFLVKITDGHLCHKIWWAQPLHLPRSCYYLVSVSHEQGRASLIACLYRFRCCVVV